MSVSRRTSSPRTFTILFCGLLAMSAACGSKDGVVPSMNSPDPFVEGPVQLQGHWKSKCLDPKEVGLGETVRFSVQGDNFQRSFQISPHGDCSSPYIEGRIEGSLIFHTNPMSEEGKAVDFKAKSAKLKPLTDLAAQVMNLAKTCGFSDWKENIEKEIYVRLGEAGCSERYPKTDYTIIATERNSAGHEMLLFGAGERLSDPSRRPVRLDRSEQVFVFDGQ